MGGGETPSNSQSIVKRMGPPNTDQPDLRFMWSEAVEKHHLQILP